MTPLDDYYIGYDTPVPPRSRRLIRGGLVAVAAVGIGVALLILLAERPFVASTFEFGVERAFTGRVVAAPYPVLELTAPERATGSSYALLVAPGKHGAATLLAPYAGRNVRLKGSLIFRDHRQAIEVVPGSIEVVAPSDAPPTPLVPGAVVTLHGEIVDGKCYLGVMNPGQGATHRDCAVRCIRGGLPPLFAVVTASGRIDVYTLASSQGTPINADVADLVGRFVDVTGRVVARGDEQVLLADTVTRHKPAD